MDIRNKENFKKFLDENVKAKVYDFEAYIEDLINQYYETGSKHYELSSFESKDKLPHLYDFEVEYELNEDGEVEKTIIIL